MVPSPEALRQAQQQAAQEGQDPGEEHQPRGGMYL
jgi:hypothetical protein